MLCRPRTRVERAVGIRGTQSIRRRPSDKHRTPGRCPGQTGKPVPSPDNRGLLSRWSVCLSAGLDRCSDMRPLRAMHGPIGCCKSLGCRRRSARDVHAPLLSTERNAVGERPEGVRRAHSLQAEHQWRLLRGRMRLPRLRLDEALRPALARPCFRGGVGRPRLGCLERQDGLAVSEIELAVARPDEARPQVAVVAGAILGYQAFVDHGRTICSGSQSVQSRMARPPDARCTSHPPKRAGRPCGTH